MATESGGSPGSSPGGGTTVTPPRPPTRQVAPTRSAPARAMWPAPPPGREATPPPSAPAPGDLHLKEPRSWRTWQLVSVAVVALLLGMLVNYNSGGSSNPSSSTGGYKLPPPKGATTSTAAPAATKSSTTTTAAGSGGTASSTPVTGTAAVLAGPVQMTGNWTSPAFTVAGGTWNIGWAFKCVPVPVAGKSLVITVIGPTGAPAKTPAVSETGGQGQSVTPQTTAGSQKIMVEAPTGCVWAAKVTGIP